MHCGLFKGNSTVLCLVTVASVNVLASSKQWLHRQQQQRQRESWRSRRLTLSCDCPGTARTVFFKDFQVYLWLWAWWNMVRQPCPCTWLINPIPSWSLEAARLIKLLTNNFHFLQVGTRAPVSNKYLMLCTFHYIQTNVTTTNVMYLLV